MTKIHDLFREQLPLGGSAAEMAIWSRIWRQLRVHRDFAAATTVLIPAVRDVIQLGPYGLLFRPLQLQLNTLKKPRRRRRM